MQFVHSREYMNAGDVVIVDSNYQANVLLLDDDNFNRYRSGQPFRHYGGHFTHFPVRITAPKDGHWNITIDLGGGSGDLRYSIRVAKAN